MFNDNPFQFSIAFVLLISVWYIEKLDPPYKKAFGRANYFALATIVWIVSGIPSTILRLKMKNLEEWVLFMLIILSLHALVTAIPLVKNIPPIIQSPIKIPNIVIIIICAIIMIVSILMIVDILTDSTLFGIPLEYTPQVEPHAPAAE